MLIVRKKVLILLILFLFFSTSYAPQALSFVVPEAPADMVVLFASTTTGQISSFKRIMPDGTAAAFTIPPGQILVIKNMNWSVEKSSVILGATNILRLLMPSASTSAPYWSQSFRLFFNITPGPPYLVAWTGGTNFADGLRISDTDLLKVKIVDSTNNNLYPATLRVNMFGFLHTP
jgi:hypothetical protein